MKKFLFMLSMCAFAPGNDPFEGVTIGSVRVATNTGGQEIINFMERWNPYKQISAINLATANVVEKRAYATALIREQIKLRLFVIGNADKVLNYANHLSTANNASDRDFAEFLEFSIMEKKNNIPEIVKLSLISDNDLIRAIESINSGTRRLNDCKNMIYTLIGEHIDYNTFQRFLFAV